LGAVCCLPLLPIRFWAHTFRDHFRVRWEIASAPFKCALRLGSPTKSNGRGQASYHRPLTSNPIPIQFQSNHALAALALTRTLTPPLNYQPTTMTCDHSALGHRPPIPNGNNNLSPRLESGNNLSRQSGAKESSPFSILHSVAMTLEHARFFIHIVCTLHILRKNN